ncbi:Zn-dependent alcohol dehydrogenase [Glutamicibacter sp.]|uniref:Zn-dependent alcohol dehydrogenase n=1 Tax=Glutamicibacter sp. TaxID=1931995 RepID=UPI002B48DDD0|nr:Zn-dependent alcohol dehydrogenase [Glutamicibacter sp.]HJX76751.1 Zn-dependent alcohol dehydrogenase [Glutamicibacter sp.]
MRAAVVNTIGEGFDIQEIEVDQPRGKEVLVKVEAAGLCHSDHIVANVDRGRPLPMVVGHEMAGIVVDLGPAATDFEIGDHVIATEISFCGTCAECVNGASYRCTSPHSALRGSEDPARLTREGHRVEGFGVAGFAEYTVLHQNKLVKVPKEIPFAQAAVLGCATATGVGAVLNAAKVAPGETVAVVGLGGIGLNVIQGARLAGAKTIIGIDLQPDKLELAKKFGATHVIHGGEQDVVAAIKEITGTGVHHSFEAIGLGATQRQAIDVTRTGGHVHFIGLPQGKPLELNVMLDLLIHQRSLHGIYMGSSNVRKDIPYYADLYLQGRLNLDDLIAQEIPLEQINEAYEKQETGAIARSVIRF